MDDERGGEIKPLCDTGFTCGAPEKGGGGRRRRRRRRRKFVK